MNKLSAALVLAALLLVSCADSTPSQTELDSQPSDDTTVESVNSVKQDDPAPAFEGFALTVGEVRLLPGETADIEALLGKANDRLTAPSCVHEGDDTVYYYDGFEVVTSPSAAGDYIISVTVSGEGIAAEEGFAVGDAFSSVDSLGAADEDLSAPDFGRYVYTRGDTSLTLLVTDDVISSITYAYEE